MTKLKYTTLRLTDEDKEYLRLKYGTVQNALRVMIENDKKEYIKQQNELKDIRAMLDRERK